MSTIEEHGKKDKERMYAFPTNPAKTLFMLNYHIKGFTELTLIHGQTINNIIKNRKFVEDRSSHT